MPGKNTLLATLTLSLAGLLASAPLSAADVAVKPAPAKSAAAADDSAAGTELAQRLKAMTSVQADFTQTSQLSGGRQPQVVTGTLSARKPGLFRWEVRQPYQQLIVADGKDIRIHDPDLQQMTIRPLGDEWAQTPALLFSGDVSGLRQQFAISRRQNGALTEFTLTPKAKDAVFAGVTLQFKGDEPFAMKLDDSLGQKTSIEFFRVKRNGKLADSLFKLVPPAGTDIIRE